MALSDPIRQIRLETARWRLAWFWFPFCGLLFLIFATQTMAGYYGDQQQRAFGWFLPTILPTTALMLSVFAADAMRPIDSKNIYVRYNFWVLAFALSAFYLILVVFPIVGSHFLVSEQSSASELIEARLRTLEGSNIFIAPIQGLVVAALGVLFFLTEQADSTPKKGGGNPERPADETDPSSVVSETVGTLREDTAPTPQSKTLTGEAGRPVDAKAT